MPNPISKTLKAALVASTALTAAPALAQDNAFDLGTLVLEAASLTAIEQARSGSNVEVLEGRDAGVDDTRVIDRLTRLPGVNTTSNGGLGAQGAIQVRGLPSRYVGVRIDGIDVSDPASTQVQFNFGGLTAAGLDRIELIKGSQSAIYGSEAIAGVVNISTYRPTELGFSGRVQAEAGAHETYSTSLSFGHKSDRGYVALSLGRIESEGISAQSFNTEKDGFEQSSLNLTGEYALTDRVSVGGAVLYRDGKVEIDRSAFSNDATGENYFEERGARVFARFDTGAIAHTLSFSRFEIDRKDPGGPTTLFQGERNSLSYLGSATLGGFTTLNFGIEHTEEDMNTGAVVGSEDNTSYTAELLYTPTEKVDLSLALRHDDNSSFGGETTGRVTAVYRAREDLSFRAAIGTGYRAPSLYERFDAVGDPTLNPETSISYELGVEKTFGDRGLVKATLFHTDVEDLIDFDGAATACGSGFGCYNQVPGTTTSRGLELSGEYALSDAVSIYGAYTYTDAETNGQRLTRTPRHDAVLGLSGDFNNGISGHLDIRHVADVVPSPFAPANNKVGDYTLVGAGVGYDIADTAEIYLRVENLFDEDYETAGGYNQPGRSAYFGFRATF